MGALQHTRRPASKRRKHPPRKVVRTLRSLVLSIVLGITQFLGGLGLVLPATARAETITFENGGTGFLTANGAIAGSCDIKLVVETVFGNTTFEVTMPDGQVLEGYCISYNHWAPADGTYPFVANPNDKGSLSVMVNSSGGAHHPIHDEHPERTFVDPPQSVGNFTWIPRINNSPASVDLRIQKLDAQTGGAQGTASLAGARFELCYYEGDYAKVGDLPASPSRRWELVALEGGDGNAVADLSRAECVVAGDELYRDKDGSPTLPEGSFTVKEIAAPEGYRLSDTVHLGHVRRDGTVEPVGTWAAASAGPGCLGVADQVQRGGITLQKGDAELHAAQAQGDASFEGIAYNVINRNERAVYVDGELVEPGAVIGGPTLVLDATGHATTGSDYLPLGSYDVVEAAGNASYQKSDALWHVSLARDGQVVTLSCDDAEAPLLDSVVRGSVKVAKADAETNAPAALGAATLSGARLEVLNEGPGPVVVGGTSYPAKSVCLTLTANEEGVAQAPERSLPYGSYRLREVEAPEGYLLNTSWEKTFSIRTDAEVVDLSGEDESLTDQVVRGDLRFLKCSGKDGSPLAGVPFLITSLTSGESHVVVTDDNGRYDSSSKWNAHSQNTNANDAALAEDGTLVSEKLDATAGLWFSGDQKAEPAAPRENLGALPYDSYRIDELRAPANEGHGLVSRTVHVKKDQELVDLGTIDDPVFSISTELVGPCADHLIRAGSHETACDSVRLEGLSPSESYRLVGELHKVVDGKDEGPIERADGTVVTCEHEFVASDPAETIEMSFCLDGANAEGADIVGFETLYQGDTKLAEHADASDALQTLYCPRLTTSLAGADGGEPLAGPWIRLHDTVRYENVTPGVALELVGRLWDAKTKEPVLDESGEQVCAVVPFVPAAREGSQRVELAFGGSAYAGRSVVATEELRRNGVAVAVHDDLDDQAQTVLVREPPEPMTPSGQGGEITTRIPTITPMSPVTPASPANPTTPVSVQTPPSTPQESSTALSMKTASASLPATGTASVAGGAGLMVSGAATLAWGMRGVGKASRRKRGQR